MTKKFFGILTLSITWSCGALGDCRFVCDEGVCSQTIQANTQEDATNQCKSDCSSCLSPVYINSNAYYRSDINSWYCTCSEGNSNR